MVRAYKQVKIVRIIKINTCEILTEIYFGRVVVPSPKIVMNLPRTYQALHCKGEPYQFSGQRDPQGQTKHRNCYFYIRMIASSGPNWSLAPFNLENCAFLILTLTLQVGKNTPRCKNDNLPLITRREETLHCKLYVSQNSLIGRLEKL